MQPGPVVSADLTLLDPIMLAAAGGRWWPGGSGSAGRRRSCGELLWSAAGRTGPELQTVVGVAAGGSGDTEQLLRAGPGHHPPRPGRQAGWRLARQVI